VTSFKQCNTTNSNIHLFSLSFHILSISSLRENLFWGYLSISLRGIHCTPSTIIVEVLVLSPVVFLPLFKGVFNLKNSGIILIFLVTLISHNLWLKLSRFHTRYPYITLIYHEKYDTSENFSSNIFEKENNRLVDVPCETLCRERGRSDGKGRGRSDDGNMRNT